MKKLQRSIEPAVEFLERRQLLSASVAGAFAQALPAALTPGAANNRVTIRVSNSGDEKERGPTTVSVYASPTPTLDTDALLLTTATRNTSLRPGAATAFHLRFASPTTLPDGSYFAVARIDGPPAVDGAAVEAIVTAAKPVQIAQPFVDLTGQIVAQPGSIFVSASRGGRGQARIRVTNQGNVASRGPMQITLYASTTGSIDGSATVIGVASFHNAAIKAGASKGFAAGLKIPGTAAVGNYLVLAVVNSANTIIESDASNNVAVGPKPLALLDAPTVIVDHHHQQDQSDDGDDSTDIWIDDGSDDGYVYDTSNTGTDDGQSAPTTAPSGDEGGGADFGPSDPGDSSDSGSSSGDSSDSGGSDFGGDFSGSDDSGGGADF